MSEYKPLTCLPVLPLRGLVVFPGVVTHFDVGRLKSAKSVEEAMRADQRIFLTAQKDLSVDDPKKNDLYAVGTVAIVKQILRMPGYNMRILVEGKFRAVSCPMKCRRRIRSVLSRGLPGQASAARHWKWK